VGSGDLFSIYKEVCVASTKGFAVGPGPTLGRPYFRSDDAYGQEGTLARLVVACGGNLDPCFCSQLSLLPIAPHVGDSVVPWVTGSSLIPAICLLSVRQRPCDGSMDSTLIAHGLTAAHSLPAISVSQ
jgi:hypothetical protein